MWKITEEILNPMQWNLNLDKETAGCSPITIFVLTFNRLEYLKKCLWSLYNHTRYPFKILVFDNSSEDGTVEFLQKLDRIVPEITAIYSPINEGTAEGKNVGLRCGSDPYMAFSDDDVWYNPGWLQKCVRGLNLWPEIAIITAFFNNDHQHDGEHDEESGFSIVYREATTPMQWVIRRKPIAASGGFLNPRWLRGKGYLGNNLMGYSGNVVCRKMRSAGYKIARIQYVAEADVRYVIAMDRKDCELNEIDRYEKSGYNRFRAIEKGLIKK